MRKTSDHRTHHHRGEIRQNREDYTYKTRESLAEHKGRDIEEQVDSWELQQTPKSILVCPQTIDILKAHR